MPFWQSCAFCTAIAVKYEKTQGTKNVHSSDVHEKTPPAQRYAAVSIHIGLHHGSFQPDNLNYPAGGNFFLAGGVDLYCTGGTALDTKYL